MSKIQLLRVFLNERLTAAAEEIFGVVEKTIAEYQEEVVRLQRLLDIDIVLQPEKNLHRAVHPDCSADQSENSQRVSGMETGGLQSGFKPVISKRTKMVKGQRSHINTKGRESTQLSLLKSPSRSNYTRCCCKLNTCKLIKKMKVFVVCVENAFSPQK
ncbi:unnamed protein product, partial [Coregonus sp. 'balchen']